MSDKELFKKNTHHWVFTCPRAATALLDLHCQHVSLCQTGDGEWNLKREEKGSETFFHAVQGAKREADKWFASLDLQGIESLFVYGVGLGYAYLAAKNWLNENRSHSLIFLEDDLEVIHHLFGTELGQEMMHNKQVRLQYFQMKGKEMSMELFSIPIVYFLANMRFSALDYYARKYPEKLIEIENQLETLKNYKGFQIMENMNYGETFFQNFYRNLFALPFSYVAEKMFGKFEGIPAIICGAGPSLEKNLSLLEKFGEHAIIIAGGSSLNTITINGFLPHFGVSSEPNWDQYARLFMSQVYAVPFFYRNKIFPQALSLMHGDHLYVSGSGGHKITEFFEKRLGFEKECAVSEGNNSIHFCLSLANALGCNPIIFVGCDMANSDGRDYAAGIIPHPILDSKKQISSSLLDESIIKMTDIYGRTVNSIWRWISESMGISQFALTSPLKTFVNASEGGIGFEGILNMTLEDVSQKHLRQQYDLSGYIHGEIQNGTLPPEATKENIIKCMEELKESLERSKDFCAALKREFHKILQQIRETGTAPDSILTDTALEKLKQLNQELAYENVLVPFNTSFSFYGQKQQETELMLEENEIKLMERRVFLNAKRYEFLKVVCENSLDHLQKALDGEKLVSLVSEAFGKQMEEAQMQSSQTRKTEDAKTEIYEKSGDNFRIVDEELKLNLEEQLVSKPLKESKEIFLDPLARLQGCYKLYYPSGLLKMEQYYKEGKLHGPSTYTSEEGVLLASSWFVNGAREGKVRYYYRNGKVYSIQRYVNGKRHGSQEYFYPDGKIKAVLPYKEGKLHGLMTLYYPDGFKKRELAFDEGKRNGLEIVWNIGGIKEFEGVYRHDKPVGIFRSWYPFGNISRVITYDEEGVVMDLKGWDVDGTPLPADLALQEDFFDIVADETKHLTNSLENVYKEIETMTESFSPQEGKKGLQDEIDFSDELMEIKKELENLRSMNKEMGVEAISKETTEALSKSSQTGKMLGEQIKEATNSMAENIKDLEEVMRMTIKILAGKKQKEEGKAEREE